MGLLRPATPLAIIFFVAFVLLLLSTLSTPIIHAIPLATFQGWNFGVFGYCKGDSQCSGYKIGYTTDGLFSNNGAGDFELPSSTRHSLSSILIVHPIAAFLALICFGLAVAAHFHGPSHSPRYLLALLILTIPTLLVSLLAFLVDILLFVPHMQWGGWIVLVATILIVASGIVICAMRRTLVSRKARKKRIAENADMNGANYYENTHQNRLMADELPKADSPPPMSGSVVEGDKSVPQFATFEVNRQDTRSRDGHGDITPMVSGAASMDDRIPLNPTRDPSVKSGSTGGGSRRPYGAEDAPPMPRGDRPQRPKRPSLDQYGNPIPPGTAVGAVAEDLPPPGLRHQGSQESMGSNRSGGYPPRGRGGYGPPDRGYGPAERGYGPAERGYGPPGRGYGPPRGGYGPPRGGGYGPRGGFRGQPPPPGWRGGRGGYGPPPRGMVGRGGMPRSGPPPGYAGPNGPYYGNGPRGPMGQRSSPRPEPDEFVAGPIGQAIEMDERSGNHSAPLAPDGTIPAYAQRDSIPAYAHRDSIPAYAQRDSDGDVAGMVSLQQSRHSPMTRDEDRESGLRSPTSIYSEQGYVPPRAQWAPQVPPLNTSEHAYAAGGPVSPIQHEPSSPGRMSPNVAVPGALPLSPIQGSPPSAQSPPYGHRRAGSDAYYEDVDPRFAVDPAPHAVAEPEGPLPSALTPGGYAAYSGDHNRMAPPPTHNLPHQSPSSTHIPSYVSSGPAEDGLSNGGHTDNANSRPPVLDAQDASAAPDGTGGLAAPPITATGEGRSRSYETLPEGARSPDESSDASHFTSVSQRGINPNWRPSPVPGYARGSAMGAPSSASAAQRRREDVILTANPDFSLPGMDVGGGGRRRHERRVSARSAAAMGLTPSGRYPTDI